jgi:hypothetical protein
MVQPHDELTIEIASEIGLNHMGEDVEDEGDNDGGDPLHPCCCAISSKKVLWHMRLS